MSVGSRYRDQPGPLIKGPTLSDKSPRQGMTKKTGKSLKEKRADKRSKSDTASQTDNLLHGKKR
ncbi:hypothetical protein ABIA65_004088 [Mycolicibacterium sp. 624]